MALNCIESIFEMPEDDICPTISGILNAYSISEDTKYCFLFSKEKNIIIKQNLETGEMNDLMWKTKNYGSERYLIYCVFQWKRLEDGLGPDKIGLLIYDLKSRKFKISLLLLMDDNYLRVIREYDLDISNIRENKLAYSAHKHGGKIEIIFYERYDKHNPTEILNFSYIAVDLTTGDIKKPKTGCLPSNGKWQLPFISEMKLHFISIERIESKIATIPINNYILEQSFTISTIISTDNNELPSKRAIWCHAWEYGIPWFIVSKPMNNSQNINNIQLWTINMRNKQWIKVLQPIQLQSDYINLSIRAPNHNYVYLYSDSYKTNNNAFFSSFNVTNFINSMRQITDEKYEELEKPIASTNYADIICPICLDTYNDPRTLFCGHSLCFACLIRMREASGNTTTDVKCPNCRKITKIPSEGLPTNYGLQKAIDMIIKTQKIRESGFKCLDCKTPGLKDDFWICINCIKAIQIDLPESSDMFCANCILKNHENHLTKQFKNYQTYCLTLQEMKDECNQKIQKTAEQIGEDFKSLIQAEIVDKLVTSSKNIVESFISNRVIHDQSSLDSQKQEVDETLKSIALNLRENAQPLFSTMLENAILNKNTSSIDLSTSPQLSPVFQRNNDKYSTTKDKQPLQHPRITSSTSSDNELFEKLIKIP